MESFTKSNDFLNESNTKVIKILKSETK